MWIGEVKVNDIADHEAVKKAEEEEEEEEEEGENTI